MRRCLPLTLILLAALTGQAFGAGGELSQRLPVSFAALAERAVQTPGGRAETAARPAALRALGFNLALNLWLELPSLEAGGLPGPDSAPLWSLLQLQPDRESFLPAQHRMRQPLSRGP